MANSLIATHFPDIAIYKKGKVRDVYKLDETLLIVATDRISCFDVVLPTPIPDKGKILTKISLFWFSFLKRTVKNHLISADIKDLPAGFKKYKAQLAGRYMLVQQCEVVPFECVVRGYLSGSAWKEYQATRSICGIKLPRGLTESEPLPKPIFTPATKAEVGHDENVDFAYMQKNIGRTLANAVKKLSIALYTQASRFAQKKGIIIADTKFEFGLKGNEIILIDEALTPDSSRFWPRNQYKPGGVQPSFDKQFVRDWLESTSWDKTPPAPELPASIVKKTREKYQEAFRLLAK